MFSTSGGLCRNTRLQISIVFLLHKQQLYCGGRVDLVHCYYIDEALGGAEVRFFVPSGFESPPLFYNGENILFVIKLSELVLP